MREIFELFKRTMLLQEGSREPPYERGIDSGKGLTTDEKIAAAKIRPVDIDAGKAESFVKPLEIRPVDIDAGKPEWSS